MKTFSALVLLSAVAGFIVSGMMAAGLVLVTGLTVLLGLISFRRSTIERRQRAHASRPAAPRRSPPPSYISR